MVKTLIEKVELAILILENVDFKMKKISRDKKVHYIIIKGSVY